MAETHVFNHRANLPDHRDLIHYEPVKEAALPKTFDLWQHYPEIRRWNQAQQGNCGGHAQSRVAMKKLMDAGVVFTQNWTVPGVDPGDRIAPAFAYYCTRQIMGGGAVNSDTGVDNRSLFKELKKYGSTREADMPYDPAVVATPPSAKAYADATAWDNVSYKSVVPANGNLRGTILAGNPIVYGWNVPDYFEETSIYKPGVDYLKLPADVPEFEGFIGGHDTVITGWDYSLEKWPVPVFVVDNSWGDHGWGLAFDAPSKTAGRFVVDARWFSNQGLVSDLTALISDKA